MKEITILSGKGGTGKTSLTAALASVAKNCVFADIDVSASDLHLILDPDIREQHDFLGGWLVSIDPDKCTGCQVCESHCRFDAIHTNNDGTCSIDPHRCEGCRLCERICPEDAITSEQNKDNYWFISSTRFGTLVHAKLTPGEENSGKLVTRVRKQARDIAKEVQADFILNDGPPGTGCSTIASLTGADQVIMVLEPSKSALHDAERLLKLIDSFSLPVYAILNKWDINLRLTKEIEIFLKRHSIPLLAKIPFNEDMVRAMLEGKTIVEYEPGSKSASQIKSIWNQIQTQAN